MDKTRLSVTTLSGIGIETLNKVAPLIIMHLAKQRLGLEAFGFALFGIALIEIVNPFIVYGYNHLGSLQVGKLGVEKKQEIGSLMADIFALKSLHTIVVFLGLLLLTYILPSFAIYRPMVYALSFVLASNIIDSLWVHMGIQKIAVINGFIGLGRTLSLILIVLFVQTPEDGILLAALTLFSNAFINFCSAIYCLRRFPLSRPNWDKMRALFSKASLFSLIMIFSTFLERIDMLLCEQRLGLAASALYSAPARIGNSLFQVANAIVVAFLSEMISAESRESLSKHLHFGIWFMLSFLSPVLFGIWFVDGPILGFIFGEEYLPVKSLLGCHLFSFTLSALISAFGLQVLLVRNAVKELVSYLLLGLIIECIAIFFLSTPFGLYGVIAGCCIGKTFSLACIMRKSLQFIDPFPFREWAKAWTPAAIMACILYFLRLENFIGNILAGGALFIPIFLWLNRQKCAMVFSHFFSKK